MKYNKIEFFTIVLNGMPFIKHHLTEFEKLDIDWTWHIVEGVASHILDTSWCKQNGGVIDKKFHTDNYLSIDGTSEYIDSISNHKNVKIYRKNDIWNGKLEMVNAPMSNMTMGDSTILFQVDVDELWTVDNINKIIDMYNNNPSYNCGYYYCYYFLGEKKYVISDNTYGTGYDHWPRTWTLREGSTWQSHEPAILVANGVNLSKQNIITRDITLSHEITFEHYAYALKEAVEFKEYYYGYKDAVNKWNQLQETTGVTDANQYIDWVGGWGGCIVDDWNKDKLLDKL